MQNISLFDIWGFSSQALKGGEPLIRFSLARWGRDLKILLRLLPGLSWKSNQWKRTNPLPWFPRPPLTLYRLGYSSHSPPTSTPPTNPSLRIFKGDIFALKLLIPFRFYAGEAVRKFPKVCSMLCGVARQEIQTLRRAQNLIREGCRKKTEKVWSFTKNIKVVRVFLSIFKPFRPFLTLFKTPK